MRRRLVLGGLAAAALAAGWLVHRPPLRAALGPVARWYGVPEAAVGAVLHAEARGKVSVLRAAGVASRLSKLRPAGGGACAWLEAFGAARHPRDGLAARLFADDAVRWLERGASGRDGLGLPYALPGAPAGCAVELPPDDDAPGRQGAAFARYWRAAPSTYRSEPGRRVQHVVLHTTEGTFASAAAWLRRPGADSGAHYAIRASDGLTVQLVDERAVAFHDACFNDASVGIEHEGFTDEGARWYSEALYRASARLVRDIASRHQIPLDRAHVLGHDEAPDCSEHTDPGGAWDWNFYWGLLTTEGTL